MFKCKQRSCVRVRLNLKSTPRWAIEYNNIISQVISSRSEKALTTGFGQESPKNTRNQYSSLRDTSLVINILLRIDGKRPIVDHLDYAHQILYNIKCRIDVWKYGLQKFYPKRNCTMVVRDNVCKWEKSANASLGNHSIFTQVH